MHEFPAEGGRRGYHPTRGGCGGRAAAASMALTQFRLRRDSLRALGLDLRASTDEIRTAYLQLAKLHHPDLAVGCKVHAAEQFKVVSQAYEQLTTQHSGGWGTSKSAAQRYEDLMHARAQEPWLIRWIWRGPSVRIKLSLKLGVMAAIFVASLVDGQGRERRLHTQQRDLSARGVLDNNLES